MEAYWLAVTPTGNKDHAATYVDLEDGAFCDDHESEVFLTLCGIYDPEIFLGFFWKPDSPNACARCLSNYRNRENAEKV